MAQERTGNMLKPGKHGWGRVMGPSKGGVCHPKWEASVPEDAALCRCLLLPSAGDGHRGPRPCPGVHLGPSRDSSLQREHPMLGPLS